MFHNVYSADDICGFAYNTKTKTMLVHNTILELKTGFHYPGSEVPKPNPGAPNLKSRPQDERPKRSSLSSLCLLGFLCRETSDPGWVSIRS